MSRLTLLSFVLLAAGLPLSSAMTDEHRLSSFAEGQSPGYQSAVLSADFDGDSKPDLAIGTTRGAGYFIEIQFTGQASRSYLSIARGGVGTRIFACDVDRDNYQDLVVTNATSLLPIAVFLGDGKGHFQSGEPWTFLPLSSFDVPSRYDTGNFPVSLAGLMPQSRPAAEGANARACTTSLQPGGWVSQELEKPFPRQNVGRHNPRSPPPASRS